MNGKKESKLKKCIDRYECSLQEYGNRLNKIKDTINQSLFEEELIAIVSIIEDEENLIRLIQDYTTNNYLIPVYTDEQEYIKSNENNPLPENLKIEPRITTIQELIKHAEADKEFEGIVINPQSQNFIIDINSAIEYNETYLK